MTKSRVEEERVVKNDDFSAHKVFSHDYKSKLRKLITFEQKLYEMKKQ